MKKLIGIILLILIGVGLYVSTNRNRENIAIEKLISSWEVTQSNFSVKAKESGRYNLPSKFQFLSPNILLVNYDDGLFDHTSVVEYKDGSFNEVSYVGAMISFIPLDQWEKLTSEYVVNGYFVSNYILKEDQGGYTKVSENVFVK